MDPVASVGLYPLYETYSYSYTFNFKWSDIGLSPGPGNGLKFESTYVFETGNSYFESFEDISGKSGFGNTITFNSYDVYGVEPVPETPGMALAIFGGIVATAGVVSRVRKNLVRMVG
jgi:hypothetical protein